jgi:hypothetical protein
VESIRRAEASPFRAGRVRHSCRVRIAIDEDDPDVVAIAGRIGETIGLTLHHSLRTGSEDIDRRKPRFGRQAVHKYTASPTSLVHNE